MTEPNGTPSNGASDLVTHRMVIGFIGSIAVVSQLVMAWLAGVGREIPPAVSNSAAAALGTLAGFAAAIMSKRH